MGGADELQSNDSKLLAAEIWTKNQQVPSRENSIYAPFLVQKFNAWLHWFAKLTQI